MRVRSPTDWEYVHRRRDNQGLSLEHFFVNTLRDKKHPTKETDKQTDEMGGKKGK